MPESVPGPKSFSSSSGKLGSTWFQLFTFEPGSQIFFSCSTVRHVAQSLSLLTTTVSASFATWNSTYSTPFVLADRRLLVLDRARGVREVGLAAAEALEAAAGARRRRP